VAARAVGVLADRRRGRRACGPDGMSGVDPRLVQEAAADTNPGAVDAARTETDVAHELNAILGRVETLEPLAREHEVPVIALKQGFGLIPLTSEIVQVLIGKRGLDVPKSNVCQDELDEVLRRWSARGPVIHATNDIYAGVGPQTARIWQNGARVFAQEGSPGSGPISMALQRLGVTGGRLGWDEFDVVGLGRHRATSRWLGTETM
jgi:hypothetical protein